MLKKISELIVTCFYIGKLPIAPGTFGSLPAFPICYMIIYLIENNKDLFVYTSMGPFENLVISAFLACLSCTFIIFIIGVIFTRYYISDRPNEDPKEVVIDEVAGQMLTITLTAISVIFAFTSSLPEYYSETSIRVFFFFVMPFALFRFFDAFKPWPISWLDQNIKGAFGVMIDDIAAAIFATILHFAIFFFILDFYPKNDEFNDDMGDAIENSIEFEQFEQNPETIEKSTLEGSNKDDYLEGSTMTKNMDLDKKIHELSILLNQSNTEDIISTAESCTGGMVASSITAISGSSSYFDRGFVTYSNDAKKDLLGVLESTLNTDGAVSKPTAEQMALGATRNSNANISVAVTGVAGPSGGSSVKPVGTVFIAITMPSSYEDITQGIFSHSSEIVSDYRSLSDKMKTYIVQFLFTGDRTQIRKKSCIASLELLLAAI